jgi:hypothetical protein
MMNSKLIPWFKSRPCFSSTSPPRTYPSDPKNLGGKRLQAPSPMMKPPQRPNNSDRNGEKTTKIALSCRNPNSPPRHRAPQQHSDYCNISLLLFDTRSAEQFQQLRKQYPRHDTMDLKIAAIVLTHNATLLTRNQKDFGQIQGLKIEDWSENNETTLGGNE